MYGSFWRIYSIHKNYYCGNKCFRILFMVCPLKRTSPKWQTVAPKIKRFSFSMCLSSVYGKICLYSPPTLTRIGCLLFATKRHIIDYHHLKWLLYWAILCVCFFSHSLCSLLRLVRPRFVVLKIVVQQSSVVHIFTLDKYSNIHTQTHWKKAE